MDKALDRSEDIETKPHWSSLLLKHGAQGLASMFYPPTRIQYSLVFPRSLISMSDVHRMNWVVILSSQVYLIRDLGCLASLSWDFLKGTDSSLGLRDRALSYDGEERLRSLAQVLYRNSCTTISDNVKKGVLAMHHALVLIHGELLWRSCLILNLDRF